MGHFKIYKAQENGKYDHMVAFNNLEKRQRCRLSNFVTFRNVATLQHKIKLFNVERFQITQRWVI